MSINFDMRGFDKVKNKLEDLQKNGEKPNGTKVSFAELFNESFMRKHTGFSSLSEFVKSGGYSTETEEFAKIPDDEFDEFVKSKTDFSSWEDMQRNALREYTHRKLGI